MNTRHTQSTHPCTDSFQRSIPNDYQDDPLIKSFIRHSRMIEDELTVVRAKLKKYQTDDFAEEVELEAFPLSPIKGYEKALFESMGKSD